MRRLSRTENIGMNSRIDGGIFIVVSVVFIRRRAPLACTEQGEALLRPLL